MIRLSFLRAPSFLTATVLLFSGTALGQEPFENGISVERIAQDLRVPLQMSFDSNGNLFVGSGFGVSQLTDIYKILPDDTVQIMPNPVSDPDALAVGPDDLVYTGAVAGRIFQISPAGSVSLWLQHFPLGNIDGLRWHQGMLYSVAIDRGKVWRIDGTTKAVSVFADFTGQGITGLTGIAFHPTLDRAYFGSPWENVILETDMSGTLLNASVASGFNFLGHMEFDPTGVGAFLFCADNGAGEILRVDLATGDKFVNMRYFLPNVGGLAFRADGDLYVAATDNDGNFGEIWRRDDLTLTEEGVWGDLVDPRRMEINSPADANKSILNAVSFNDFGVQLKTGRTFPLGPGAIILLGYIPLDANGHCSFKLQRAGGAPLVSGLQLHFSVVSFNDDPAVLGIAEKLAIIFP